MKNLRKGESLVIFGDGRQTRDFVSVEDVVAAIMLALDSEAAGVYNIGTGAETSIQSLAEKMISIAGRRSTPTYAPARTGDIRRSVAVIRRAKEQLGYSPGTNLDEDLRRLWNWYLTT
jgi:UDP-glucose 4-epimerase